MQDTGKQLQEARNREMKTRAETTCCIVGAGPAGAMLALLLARKGVEVTLLEEHTDFARDFRGDTVHPSTMDILEQIGMAERVLQIRHTEAREMAFATQRDVVATIQFSHLKTHYPYIAFIPQVHFLECVTEAARRYPNFQLIMGARMESLIEEDGYIHGVQYRAQDGWHELRAVLTVGTDGRFSRVRKLAGFEPVKSAPPMDVLWFRLPRHADDPGASGGKLDLSQGHLLIRFDRGDEWQIAYTIPKGSYQKIKAAGLESLRAALGKSLPTFADRLQTITEWKQISVLVVESSILKRWYRPGLLLIGDAAHVMSPVAGVGINLAIQDAVATANILTGDLQQGKVRTTNLARIQRRRELPTQLVQGFQRLLQKQIFDQIQTSNETPTFPLSLRLAMKIPLLRSIPMRFIAFGPRRERVKMP